MVNSHGKLYVDKKTKKQNKLLIKIFFFFSNVS